MFLHPFQAAEDSHWLVLKYILHRHFDVSDIHSIKYKFASLSALKTHFLSDFYTWENSGKRILWDFLMIFIEKIAYAAVLELMIWQRIAWFARSIKSDNSVMLIVLILFCMWVKAESLFGDDMLGEGDCLRSTGLNFRGFLRG